METNPKRSSVVIAGLSVVCCLECVHSTECHNGTDNSLHDGSTTTFCKNILVDFSTDVDGMVSKGTNQHRVTVGSLVPTVRERHNILFKSVLILFQCSLFIVSFHLPFLTAVPIVVRSQRHSKRRGNKAYHGKVLLRSAIDCKF